MALGYSSRNKSLRVALLAAAVALGLLMLYLHGCARAEAASLHTALADAHGRHTRITDELKITLQGHAQLERELKNERVLRSSAEEDKDKAMMKCAEDLRSLRDTHAREKATLVRERDSYQLMATKHESSYEEVKAERDRVQEQYEKNLALTDQRYSALSTSCKDTENSLQQKAQQMASDLSVVQLQLSEASSRHEFCSVSLASAKEAYAAATKRLVVLETEAQTKDSEIAQLRSRLLPLLALPQQPQAQQLLYNGATNKVEKDAPPPGPPPGQPPTHVSEERRLQVYLNLQAQLARGEELSPKQSQIYSLLRRQFGNRKTLSNHLTTPVEHTQPTGGERVNQSERPTGGEGVNRPRQVVVGNRPHPLEEQEEVRDLRDEEDRKVPTPSKHAGDNTRRGAQVGVANTGPGAQVGGADGPTTRKEEEEEFDNLEAEGRERGGEGAGQDTLDSDQFEQQEKEEEAKQNFHPDVQDPAGNAVANGPSDLDRGTVHAAMATKSEAPPQGMTEGVGRVEGVNLDQSLDDYDEKHGYGEDDHEGEHYKDRDTAVMSEMQRVAMETADEQQRRMQAHEEEGVQSRGPEGHHRAAESEGARGEGLR